MGQRLEGRRLCEARIAEGFSCTRSPCCWPVRRIADQVKVLQTHAWSDRKLRRTLEATMATLLATSFPCLPSSCHSFLGLIKPWEVNIMNYADCEALLDS